MSLLGSIVSKILNPFGGSSDAKAADAPASAPAATPTAPKADAATAAGADVSDASSGKTTYFGDGPSTTGALPNDSVDITEVLNGLAAKNPQKLDWKHSIVDLLKLLDLDSSLAARKELAGELNYTGDTNDSATMNVWLHKQVIKKVQENGGKVPPELA